MNISSFRPTGPSSLRTSDNARGEVGSEFEARQIELPSPPDTPATPADGGAPRMSMNASVSESARRLLSLPCAAGSWGAGLRDALQ